MFIIRAFGIIYKITATASCRCPHITNRTVAPVKKPTFPAISAYHVILLDFSVYTLKNIWSTSLFIKLKNSGAMEGACDDKFD
jgi:hypothetical protein